jgi:hypothetical protein
MSTWRIERDPAVTRATLVHPRGTAPTMCVVTEQDSPLSALPSGTARALAFVAIIVTGLAGALIGYGTVDVQCTGECGTPLGVGILLGAVLFAGGAAIIAVLVLRALGEWRELDDGR